MAGAPKRANKRRRRTAVVNAAPTPPAQVDVSVHGLLEAKANKWKTPVAVAGGLIAIAVAGWSFYKWAGLPVFVDTRQLEVVETGLRKHVDETKAVVIDHADKNAAKINEKVGGLVGTLTAIQQTQRQQTLDAMRRQEDQFDLDIAKLVDSLSSLDTQIRTATPNTDLQFLRERKQVLEANKRALERKAAEIRDRISRMERPDRPAQ